MLLFGGVSINGNSMVNKHNYSSFKATSGTIQVPFLPCGRCGKWPERKPSFWNWYPHHQTHQSLLFFGHLSSRIWFFPPSCRPATASMGMPFRDRCWPRRWPRRHHSATGGTRHKGHGHGDGTRRSRRFVGMKKKKQAAEKQDTSMRNSRDGDETIKSPL